MYIPPSDSEMLYKLDLELEKYTMIFHCCYLVNLMPDIQLGINIVKHLTKIVKFWNTLWVDISCSNSKGQNSTSVHKRGSCTIDLVLTGGINILKCQTKEFDLIDTCHKGIITTIQDTQKTHNQKYKTKCANCNAWKTDLTSSLKKISQY